MLRLFFSSIVNNFKVIMTFYIVSLLLMAFMFSDTESHSFIDSLYWATCTSLTIGYGDFSPHSTLMKVLTILFAHFWAFIVIPAVIIKFFMTFIEDRDEFTHEEQEEIKEQLWRMEILLNNLSSTDGSRNRTTESRSDKRIKRDDVLYDIINDAEKSKNISYPPHLIDNPDFILIH